MRKKGAPPRMPSRRPRSTSPRLRGTPRLPGGEGALPGGVFREPTSSFLSVKSYHLPPPPPPSPSSSSSSFPFSSSLPLLLLPLLVVPPCLPPAIVLGVMPAARVHGVPRLLVDHRLGVVGPPGPGQGGRRQGEARRSRFSWLGASSRASPQAFWGRWNRPKSWSPHYYGPKWPAILVHTSESRNARSRGIRSSWGCLPNHGRPRRQA